MKASHLILFAAALPGAAIAEMNLAALPSTKFDLSRDWAPKHYWKDRIERQNAHIKSCSGVFDLVFIGDSITHNWEGWPEDQWREVIARPGVAAKLPAGNCPGRACLERLKEMYSVLNLGIGGDTTGEVIWRIRYGRQLAGYKARCIMLMIGTNNREENPADVAAGIRVILDEITARQPDAVVALLAIFPRGSDPSDKRRVRNDKVNEIIHGFADGRRIVWVDFNRRFLDGEGRVKKSLMPDFLHPNEAGYEIWTESVLPVFEAACGKRNINHNGGKTK